MLDAKSKKILENKIYKILKESMFENGDLGFTPDYSLDMLEKKKKHDRYRQDTKSKTERPDSHDSDDQKEAEVMKWLHSAQEKHSQLAYNLFPDITKDAARSLFSKKYRQEDNEGNSYHFDEEEINKLYNMKDDFLDAITENKYTADDIKRIIAESIKKYLK